MKDLKKRLAALQEQLVAQNGELPHEEEQPAGAWKAGHTMTPNVILAAAKMKHLRKKAQDRKEDGAHSAPPRKLRGVFGGRARGVETPRAAPRRGDSKNEGEADPESVPGDPGASSQEAPSANFASTAAKVKAARRFLHARRQEAPLFKPKTVECDAPLKGRPTRAVTIASPDPKAATNRPSSGPSAQHVIDLSAAMDEDQRIDPPSEAHADEDDSDCASGISEVADLSMPQDLEVVDLSAELTPLATQSAPAASMVSRVSLQRRATSYPPKMSLDVSPSFHLDDDSG